MLEVSSGTLTLSLCEKTGTFSVKFKYGKTVSQMPPKVNVVGTERDGDTLILKAEQNGLKFSAAAKILSDNEVELKISASGKMTAELDYPSAICVDETDEMIVPIGDGIIFPTTYKFPEDKFNIFFKSRNLYGGTTHSMSCVGLLGKERSVLAGVENGCDAKIKSEYIDGIMHIGLSFMPQKGEFGYDRVVRYFVTDNDDMPYLCSLYRGWRESLGMVTTMKEKVEKVPNVKKIEGAADFWIFDDNTTNRLYGRKDNPDGKVLNTAYIAEELNKLGVDKALINSFETQEKEKVEKIKSFGYLTGRYDIYRDMIPASVAHLMLPFRLEQKKKHVNCWPDQIIINADGTYKKAWALHGTDGNMYDQNAICDICAIELTKKDVPEMIESNGYNSWFIDVQVAAALNECYSEDHPMTRSDARDAINEQNTHVLYNLGIVNGVEAGQEMFVKGYCYAEGIMSPAIAQAPDAGRNMDTIYYGDKIPDNIKNYGLNPAFRYPLWELTYHDCAVSYWYWGDSSTCCPELIRTRDALNALYGTPPLYAVNMTQFEEFKELIAESYKRAIPVARKTAESRMTGFRRLTDDCTVQESKFENGLTVVANFSDTEYVHESGKKVAPKTAIWF